MERYRYIAKRLLTAIPTFLGITILVYVVASLAPSSPLEILFNDPYATAEEMARKSRELGLDQPVVIQYIRWLVQLLQGNMGMSIRTNGQVLDMILERIGPTLILTGSAMALTIIIALPLGIMSAYKPYSGWDYISSGLSFIGSAMPNFFAGLVLIYFFCIKVKLFPYLRHVRHLRSQVLAHVLPPPGASGRGSGHPADRKPDTPVQRLHAGGAPGRLCAHGQGKGAS